MVEFIIFPIMAMVLLWIAIVSYMIYKDHGIVEYIDHVPYKKVISINPSVNGEPLNLRERLRKRFRPSDYG